MVVRFDACWSGITSSGRGAAAGALDCVEGGLQRDANMLEGQQAAGEDPLEGALGIGSIGAGRRVGWRRLRAERLAELVGRNLGGEVLLKGKIEVSPLGPFRRRRCLIRLKASSTRQRR